MSLNLNASVLYSTLRYRAFTSLLPGFPGIISHCLFDVDSRQISRRLCMKDYTAVSAG